jgi:Ca2+-binding EF-hand superfamily protein
MDGEYVEHSDRHGAVNFDVFRGCSSQEQQEEFRKRFNIYRFPSPNIGPDPGSATKAITDSPLAPPEPVPIPGPHAVPIDLVKAAIIPKAKTAQPATKETRGRREGYQKNRHRKGGPGASMVWEATGALFKNGPFSDFFKWAHKKFGSLPRCWKMLDDDCNMRITRTEFLKTTRKYEFMGDARAVFKILDRDQTDHVTFFHFDPVGAVELAELQRWAQVKFGGIQQAFKALDQDRNGQLTKKEFFSAAKTHDLPTPQAAKTLFLLLDNDDSHTLSELEVAVIDQWRYPPWLTAMPDHNGAQAFKQYLLRRHNDNPIRAWRKALDKHSTMRVSWDVFEAYCRSTNCIHKDRLAGVWKSLDDNMSGWLSLREFWPDACDLLQTFVKYCKEFYGSVHRAFVEIDNNGNGRLSHSEFKMVAEACKFAENESDLVFAGLDLQGDGRVDADDVTFLDKWYVDRDNKEEELWNQMAQALKQIAQKRQSEDDD